MVTKKNNPALDMAALAVLGLDPKEIEDKVVDRIADRVLEGWGTDEEGDYVCDSQFKRKLDKRIQDQVDATIAAMAEKHVLPNVGAYIENLTLQKTNQWGEKTGSTMTFIEYLVQRAEAYMKEPVDYQGKPSKEDRYATPQGTRISWMVDQHLNFEIQKAMEEAYRNGNAMIVGGLKAAMDMALGNIRSSLKVTADVKSR